MTEHNSDKIKCIDLKETSSTELTKIIESSAEEAKRQESLLHGLISKMWTMMNISLSSIEWENNSKSVNYNTISRPKMTRKENL